MTKDFKLNLDKVNNQEKSHDPVQMTVLEKFKDAFSIFGKDLFLKFTQIHNQGKN